MYKYKANDYCKCKSVGTVTSDFNDYYEFDICCNCGKIIENSFRELNHYDGKDHVNYDIY